MKKDLWYGARLGLIRNNISYVSVKDKDCGIFPLTHVWGLREDLLPEYVFSDTGIIIESPTSEIYKVPENVQPNTPLKLKPTSYSDFLYYVKVIKTMKAQLSEEIDLSQIGEILGVTSDSDKLYYYGRSLDGTRIGMFPKNYVEILKNYDSAEINCTPSTTPIPGSNPPNIPPPSPPSHISIIIILITIH